MVCCDDGLEIRLSGADPTTTNNRMELQAVIATLEFLTQTNQQSIVNLYADSQYVLKGITQWVPSWKRKGWKTAAGKAVLNKDLWQKLDELNSLANQQLPLAWRYIKGHSGDEGNELADTIAREQAESVRS